ncbi:hypothetical protein MNBD_PLANCTO03-1170 [hydrothermal vent metagenome]|uniref:Uncharacterized protein n=1 Tax=hydrothermal vent metagenome TaxID=652676 RepID=A0A3B1E1D9_9ZZZZ
MLLVPVVRQIVLPFLVLALLVFPGRALAQTVPVEPYYVVTTRADVPLKSGDMDGYYPVATLKAGQVLWVDAEGSGWVRVAYPPGLSVYVPASEVREEEGGGVVVLARVSALKSRNASAGFAQSWQRAIPRNEEPAIGTRLHVLDVIEGADGGVMGYEVEPPAMVRGYVKADVLRAATDAEVEAYLATIPESAAEEPGAEEAPEATEEPSEAAEPVETEQPADEAESDLKRLVREPESITESLREPTAHPDDAQAQPEFDQSETDQPELDETVAEGEAGEAGTEVIVIDQTPTPQTRLIGTLTHLAELFNKVQKQDSNTAELDELAAELRRAIAAQGDDPIGRRIRTALGQRLQLIEMRIAARDARRQLRARRESIEASYVSIITRVHELETTRGYQFVGRLVRSSVYDGRRLPLMYRIVSVNESVPRTIGYIMPSETLDYRDMLGEIVGVLGTSQLDEALNLRIVTPSRIDVLAPEGLGLPTPADADSASWPGS